MAKVFEETLTITELRSEDGGRALIVESDADIPSDENLFVRIQSWSDERRHLLLQSLAGKTVKITIETVDE